MISSSYRPLWSTLFQEHLTLGLILTRSWSRQKRKWIHHLGIDYSRKRRRSLATISRRIDFNTILRQWREMGITLYDMAGVYRSQFMEIYLGFWPTLSKGRVLLGDDQSIVRRTKMNPPARWYIYLSSVMFTLLSGLCLSCASSGKADHHEKCGSSGSTFRLALSPRNSNSSIRGCLSFLSPRST